MNNIIVFGTFQLIAPEIIQKPSMPFTEKIVSTELGLDGVR